VHPEARSALRVPRVPAAISTVAIVVLSLDAVSSAQQKAAPQAPAVLKGEIRLSKDMRVAAPRIVLEDLVLVTNGFRLEITGDTLEVRGAAAIRAFDPPVPQPTGQPGRAAGLIAIRAQKMSGPMPTIDNSGEAGMPGRPGTPGREGRNGSQGKSFTYLPWTGCTGGRPGSAGEPGGPGGEGGPGGPGGNGGVVLIDLGPATKAIVPHIVVNGGRGGRGGDAGPGGPGGKGGPGAPAAGPCGVTLDGPQGPTGSPGARGPDGPDGKPGSIFSGASRTSSLLPPVSVGAVLIASRGLR
jgi:hypothetical protein